MAALLLLPIALRQGALGPALRHWRPILAFATIEMAGPFLLLGHAEQTLPSGLTGLLVATVPLFGAVVAFGLGDRHALRRARLVGLAVGLAGVGLVVGAGRGDGTVRLASVAEVLLVAVCYSVAPFITHRRLGDVSGIGIATLSLAMVGTAYIPVALLAQHHLPSARSAAAVGGLAVLCTAIAFVTFFALIREVGPAHATVITFVNPAVALTLGVTIRGEHLSLAQVVGLPVVLAGCWLAAGGISSNADQVDEAEAAETR
jgi:drug/metabolite transporter (DMT)-like permease